MSTFFLVLLFVIAFIVMAYNANHAINWPTQIMYALVALSFMFLAFAAVAS